MTREPAILMRYIALTADFGGELDRLRAWLTSAEQSELARFRHPLRRRQWIAGRRLSKQLLAETLGGIELCDIQILTRDGRGLGSRPVVSIDGQAVVASLSISHTQRGVLIALSTDASVSLGVDLTERVPCDERFQALWFTAHERCWICGEATRAALIWSIKEAVYKACQTGQGWSPRLVEVEALADGDFACSFDEQMVDGLQLTIEEFDSQLAVVAAVSAQYAEQNDPELLLASCS